MDLTGRTALVAGGNGTLGGRIVRRLGAAGVKVAVGWRGGRDRAEALAGELRAAGGEAAAVPLDILDEASIDAAVALTVETFGGLDILVSSAGAAGGPPPGDLEALTPEIWDRLMAINLRGPYLLARAAAPHLREAAPGRVVLVGSTIGLALSVSAFPFTVSKAGVVPLTRFLAASLAPQVRVNCVAPGLMEGTAISGRASPEYVQGWKDRSLLGASTSIDEVAAQVVAFCGAETVTGQTVVVDGGITFA